MIASSGNLEHALPAAKYTLRNEQANDRTAGSIPVWSASEPTNQHTPSNTEKSKIEYTLSNIDQARPPAQTLSYNESTKTISQNTQKSGGFSFYDMIDVVNPLQHIPVVNTVYRSITNDEIGTAARILGGGIFGGAIGATMGVLNAVVEQTTGQDIGTHVIDLVLKNDSDVYEPQKDKLDIAHLPGTAIAVAKLG